MDDAPAIPKLQIDVLSKTKVNELNKKLIDQLTDRFTALKCTKP